MNVRVQTEGRTNNLNILPPAHQGRDTIIASTSQGRRSYVPTLPLPHLSLCSPSAPSLPLLYTTPSSLPERLTSRKSGDQLEGTHSLITIMAASIAIMHHR